MWFKNLQLYRLTEEFKLDAEQLHEKLQQRITKSVQGLDTFSLGWDKPLGREGQLLTHAVNNCIMVCMRREERLLPASVVREVLEEKVAEIEAAESRTVGRKEKQQLKDEITITLLPKAFTRSSRTFAYIDLSSQWVLVDTPSAKKAEDVLSLMRETLGSFKVKPFEVNQAPMAILTDWLKRQPPTDFALQDECELRDTLEDGGIVRLRRHGMAGTEIEAHLDAGKMVTRLAVEWEEKIACVLCDDVTIKRLKFLGVLQDESGEAEAESFAEQFDVDFAIMSLELRKLVERMVTLFGGLNQEV